MPELHDCDHTETFGTEECSECTEARVNQSTGPTSSTGNVRSSRNSTTHGCTSTALIVPDESEEDFNRLKQTFERFAAEMRRF